MTRMVRAFAALLLGITLAVPALAKDKTIWLGIQPAPVLSWVVKEKGLLEKRGFKPEWIVFPYAAPELEAMAAGSVDLAVMGTLPMVMVALKDSDLWYFYDELGNGSGMVVGASSTIKSGRRSQRQEDRVSRQGLPAVRAPHVVSRSCGPR